MALNILGLLSTCANLILKNTATVDSGLKEKTKKVYHGIQGMSEIHPVSKHGYPVIFCELVNKSEQLDTMGNTSSRVTDIEIDIVPVIDIGAGRTNAHTVAQTEIIKMAQNIETVFRTNISLSQTVEWCNIENTDYSVRTNDNTTWVQVAKINLKIGKRTF